METKTSSVPSVDIDAISVVAGGVLMAGGVVVFAAPIPAVREFTESNRTLARVLGLGLIATGVVLISKPMFAPILDGVRFSSSALS